MDSEEEEEGGEGSHQRRTKKKWWDGEVWEGFGLLICVEVEEGGGGSAGGRPSVRLVSRLQCRSAASTSEHICLVSRHHHHHREMDTLRIGPDQ